MQETMVKMVKAGAFVLIAVAAVIASYQYKLSVDGVYPTRTFSVDGMGEIEVVPDIATFSVTVTTDGGKNVTEVQSANTEKMNAVTAFLKEQGIDKKDLKTGQYNLSPRYSYGQCFGGGNCPAPTITGYNLTQTLEVKVRESDKLGDLLSGVVTSGANSVSEVRFVVDDDTEAKDRAREEAIADAKKKAKATAKAAGFRLGRLVTLYENANPVTPYGMGGALDMAAVKSEAVPAVEPGTQATKVQVTLTYEVKD
jgi:uncharacterized protein